jgi:hypothetical protein
MVQREEGADQTMRRAGALGRLAADEGGKVAELLESKRTDTQIDQRKVQARSSPGGATRKSEAILLGGPCSLLRPREKGRSHTSRVLGRKVLQAVASFSDVRLKFRVCFLPEFGHETV